MKKPTHRQYQMMIAHCMLKGSIECSKLFQPIVTPGYPDCCSNCKIAFDFKNKEK